MAESRGAIRPSTTSVDEAGTPAHPRSGPSIESVCVLLVEDELDSLELLCMVLEGAGAHVTAARNASDALEAREAQGSFDIIISDIGMLEMDGYAFVRHVRSREAWATIPAIALTAYARREDAVRAIRAGFQEHLAKPVDPDRLLDVVSQWTRRGSRAAP
jgi:CheY-like chemotaxis protein